MKFIPPAPWRPRIGAIDCGARHAACGWFVAGPGGRLVLQEFALEPVDAGPELHGGWPDAAGRALASLTVCHKPGATCRLALSGRHTLVKFVRTPSLGPAGQSGAVAFAARQNIPCPPDQAVWDHLTVDDDGADLKFVLAAAKSNVASAIHGAAAAAGFDVAQIVPAGIALMRAFRYTHPAESGRVLVVEVGAHSTHLVLIDGERFCLRTFAQGGDAITRHMAEELDVDFAMAEKLKTRAMPEGFEVGTGGPARAAMLRAAAAFASRLHLEMVRTFLGCGRDFEPGPVQTVYLTGGGSLVQEFPAMLGDKLAVQVKRFDPLGNVILLPSARESAGAARDVLAAVVGLATSLIDSAWPAINLLPPEVIKLRASGRVRRALVASAALLAAAPVPVIWRLHDETAAAEGRSIATEERLVPLRALAARNARTLAHLKEAGTQIELARKLADARWSWNAFFNDLQDRVTETGGEIWLERLQLVRPTESTARSAGPARAGSLRLAVAGRLLDRENPEGTRAGVQARQRVGTLLQKLGRSTFVAAIENERFDQTQPGLLGFSMTLVMNPAKLP
jgi:type IV pilus assembly protein PilM